MAIAHYERTASLYQRFERGEITHANLLELRARDFARAERDLNIESGQLNNIALANFMTYSRHYPALERIADSWGTDLPGMIEFFRLVDARKPPVQEMLKRLGATDEKHADFLRGYEAAVLETIRAAASSR